MRFTEFDLDEKVVKGIEAAGFTECLPVQEKSIAETIRGRDVSVQSQTGSGKTAAFMIPLLQYYCVTPANRRVRTLIVAPTRELAIQIENDAKILSSAMDVTIGCFYGGVGYKQQENTLQNGVDIIIGTPGRLIDFGKSGKLNFKEIGKFVIDEADRLFDMGFYPDIKQMMRMLPPREKRQTMLFSATLSNRVRNIAWEYMNIPVEIEIEPENVTVDSITQVLYHVSTAEKMSLLLGLMKKYQPENAIIFTNTKHAAVVVAERLKRNGYDVVYMMGDLPQKKRLAVIKKVKAGEVRFLVATDVAARGLHVDDLELVVNYDIPEDFENYVHRIGRTARAGKSGMAITLACEKYVYGLEAIEKFIGFKIPVEWAEADLYVKDKSAGSRLNIDRSKPSTGRISRGSSGHSGRRKSRGASRTNAAGTAGRVSLQGKPRIKPKKTGASAAFVKDKNTAKMGFSKSSDGERKRKIHPAKKNRIADSKISSGKQSEKSAEERLAYYREKYGEDFTFSREMENSDSNSMRNTVDSAVKKKKEGIFKKLFKRKKK